MLRVGAKELFVAFLFYALALAGCGATTDPALEARKERARKVREYVRLALPAEERERPLGRLLVDLRDVATTGTVMMLRTRIRSTYDEPVEGVRLVLTFLGARNGTMIPLETKYFEQDIPVPPWGSALLRLDVESLYLGAQVFYDIRAYPKKVGARPVDPPPGWPDHLR
ncbi:MAG: hypothetical protein KatS3mg076_3127 [Candidatus Binatia bacterium]|nr:MAG: hypothetical protein KatS3mg076_3127 [Candidatus Binatia bacterium]